MRPNTALLAAAAVLSLPSIFPQNVRWAHHGSPFSSAAASTNLLVTSDGSGLIKLWSLTNGTPSFVKTLAQHKLPIYDLSISEDGSAAVSSSADTTTRVWNLVDGTSYVAAGGSRFGPFTHHSKRNLLGILDYGGDLTILDLNSGTNVLEMAMPSLNPIALSPRRDQFVTYYGEVIGVYSISSRSVLRDLIFPLSARSEIERIAFSPDGSKIAAAAHVYSPIQSESVAVFDVDSGAVELIGGDGSAGLGFSPDGTILATEDVNYNVTFRNVQTKELIRMVGSEEYQAIAFLSTNQVLVGNNILTLSSGELVSFIEPVGTMYGLKFSEDGAFLASENALWNAQNGDLVTTFKYAPSTNSEFAKSSIQPIRRSVTPILFGPNNTVIVRDRIFDRASGEQISQLLVGHPSELTDLAKNWYYTSGFTSTNIAELRRYSDGEVIRTLSVPGRNGSLTIGTSPSQALIATARTHDSSFDKSVRIWNSADGSLIHTISNGVAVPYKLTISSDENVVASASEQYFGQVAAWDIHSGRKLFGRDNVDSPAMGFDLLYGSNFLLWGYDGLNVTDLQTGVTTMTLTNETFQVTTVAVSPDQRSIAIARNDGVLLMLETPRVDRLGVQIQSSTPSITFFALPSKSYAIDSSLDLQTWTSITNFTGSGARFVKSIPQDGPAFYRLRTD